MRLRTHHQRRNQSSREEFEPSELHDIAMFSIINFIKCMCKKMYERA